jgi:transketolase
MEKAVNTLRVLAAETVTNANSGHSGIALGAAPIMYAIYKHMNFDPTNGAWFNRDRFVMSAGHGSALLYATLKCFGVAGLDLKAFRKFGSQLTGHPEVNESLCIDCSTGPLGQGIAMSVGIALAEKRLNKITPVVSHYTYCLVGDGCLMEGASYEACNLAGLWGLGKLIVVYDCNNITLDGTRGSADGEDTALRFRAMNWNVIDSVNGNDADAVFAAIEKAKTSTKPTIIIAKTEIGFGSKVRGTNKAHGSVLSAEEIEGLKKSWGISAPAFEIDKDVAEHFKKLAATKIGSSKKWKPSAEIKNFIQGTDRFKFNGKGIVNARDIGHNLLSQAAAQSSRVIGGSADVASSTKVFVDGAENIAYGVREFAMSSISCGLALHGFIPFCSTFFAFSDYCKPSMRIAALMDLPVIYIFTHDGLGNPPDGPTHQATEHIVAMRITPNIKVYRPSSEAEAVHAFEDAFNSKRPACIILSRGDLCNLEIKNPQNAKLNLVASGAEIGLCVKAQELLEQKGIKAKLFSVPCIEEFEKSLCGKGIPGFDRNLPCLAVELGSGASMWAMYGKCGLRGDVLSFDDFGKCGKDADVLAHLGFTAENIVARAILTLGV